MVRTYNVIFVYNIVFEMQCNKISFGKSHNCSRATAETETKRENISRSEPLCLSCRMVVSFVGNREHDFEHL